MPVGVAAGQLRERFSFQRHALDANGDPLGPFAELYQCAAKLEYLHGGEAVMGQRLEGKQPVVITVHACNVVLELTTADRAVNVRTGEVFDVQGVEPDLKRIWTQVLATSKAGGEVG